MTFPLPEVKVWKPGGSQWELCALPIRGDERGGYTELRAEKRHLDFGTWSMGLPSSHPAVVELAPTNAWHDRLVTIKYADRFTMTGLVGDRQRSRSADAGDTFAINGAAALAILGWVIAYQVPTAGLAGQNAKVRDIYPPVEGTFASAEEVVRYYIDANLSRWQANKPWPPIIVEPSLGRGAQVRGRARMRPLWQIVQAVSRRGGIGVDVGLVETSPTRADLRVTFYVPQDRTLEARLSDDIGVLRSWESSQGVPEVTRAIIGDAGKGTNRVFTSVERGAGWIETFVNVDDSTDPAELTQRGEEALDEGAAEAAFTLEAEDTELVRYGRDYGLGDTVTVQVGDAGATDFVSGVSLAVAGDGIVSESPIVGDPDRPDPLFQLGRLVRNSSRRVMNYETG